MNTVMPEETLREIFDRLTREVTRDAVGIPLSPVDRGPEGEVCTVHIGFTQGFHSSLSLRADVELFARMTRTLLQTEEVAGQDVEDVTKEYFNVLCGHIAKVLYEQTGIPSRFDVPFFCRGSFAPRGQRVQFILNYADERNNAAQLVHHIPDRSGQAPAAGAATRKKGADVQ